MAQVIGPVGRFAPSPTGDLHFGSLLAALASFCHARAQNGTWRLRIDDIDAPRSVAGSAAAIQRSLDTYGFEWDGQVIWQSLHLERYHDALSQLISDRRVFACHCARRSLPAGKVYPGRCRENLVTPTDTETGAIENHALRLFLSGNIGFKDAIQGECCFDLAHDVGDIIIWRRDGLVSYSLACAVDDADGITHVVRGADLLQSTGAQMGIMQALALNAPRYAHIPVAIDANGDKLSKHSRAQPIDHHEPLTLLTQAWHLLGQPKFEPASINEFWAGAFQLWDLQNIPATACISV